ncbi:hypothetical protein [Methanobrevibacter arboriphilus]|nr:hypothetical protein [Methanobrevibacter arboriphilus]
MDNIKCINNLNADDWENAWKNELGEEIKKKKNFGLKIHQKFILKK